MSVNASIPRSFAYPFAAVVGNSRAKLALMLLAVDRRLRGAIIAGAPGTAKSRLAHSFASLTGAHLVEVPLGVTEDRLLGGIDIERTLAAGARRASKGLLAHSHQGALLIDDINLMDENLCGVIANALEERRVRVEREGLSAVFQSDFVLIATGNPAEGQVSPILKDRAGLLVEIDLIAEADDRAEMISRAVRFDADPAGFNEEFEDESHRIKSLIERARKRLRDVRMSDDGIRALAAAALRLGVEGNRADIFAVRAARASAALHGRREVIDEDIITAIQFVLAPRAHAPDVERSRTPESASSEYENDERESEGAGDASIEDLIVQATDAQIPDEAVRLSPFRSRHTVSGKRIESIGSASGRYVGSTGRRPPKAKVALDATLRAAAPHQKSRRKDADRRVQITADDLRYKRLGRRSGVLFLFAVDASSSMLANRFSQAKGAIIRLLRQAYLHRDRVALVSFRGNEAEVLLQPTRSVELGRRLVDALPAGGATPIARGLISAMEVAARAQARDSARSLLLVMTDGRANVGLGGESDQAAIERELREIGAALSRGGVQTVVIDTRSKFVSSGEGRALAEALGGRYVYLPRLDESSIYEAVSAAASEMRQRD